MGLNGYQMVSFLSELMETFSSKNSAELSLRAGAVAPSELTTDGGQVPGAAHRKRWGSKHRHFQAWRELCASQSVLNITKIKWIF